jgi:hypothetical protein
MNTHLTALITTILIAITWLATTNLPSSAEVLQGYVLEENLRLQPSTRLNPNVPQIAPPRISRNSGPLKGNVIDTNAFSPSLQSMPGKPALGGMVSSNDFSQLPKNFDLGAERSSRELVLAWERWHKQLSKAIYDNWSENARTPGRATIRIVVTRNRTIDAQVISTTGGGEFNRTIISAIEGLNGNPGLTFPSKSERQQVGFEADYIAGTNIDAGYSWIKNDYEKVKEDY